MDLKFLMILSLNLCFVSEVTCNHRVKVWAVGLQFACLWAQIHSMNGWAVGLASWHMYLGQSGMPWDPKGNSRIRTWTQICSGKGGSRSLGSAVAAMAALGEREGFTWGQCLYFVGAGLLVHPWGPSLCICRNMNCPAKNSEDGTVNFVSKLLQSRNR